MARNSVPYLYSVCSGWLRNEQDKANGVTAHRTKSTVNLFVNCEGLAPLILRQLLTPFRVTTAFLRPMFPLSGIASARDATDHAGALPLLIPVLVTAARHFHFVHTREPNHHMAQGWCLNSLRHDRKTTDLDSLTRILNLITLIFYFVHHCISPFKKGLELLPLPCPARRGAANPALDHSSSERL